MGDACLAQDADQHIAREEHHRGDDDPKVATREDGALQRTRVRVEAFASKGFDQLRTRYR
jgi:hypothetical protein